MATVVDIHEKVEKLLADKLNPSDFERVMDLLAESSLIAYWDGRGGRSLFRFETEKPASTADSTS